LLHNNPAAPERIKLLVNGKSFLRPVSGVVRLQVLDGDGT